MLEKLTKKMSQVFVAALVILISAVFILEFGGPQSKGCASGGATYAARVYGETISEGDFRASYALAGFDRYSPETAEQYDLRLHTLNGLIERTLLARRAREVGLSVTEDEVMSRLAEEGTVYLSMGIDAPPNMPSGEVPVPVRDAEGAFDSEAAKRFIRPGLRRSVGEVAQAQVEEQLASRMRDTVRATVDVSRREVWEAYVREREQAKVEYVRFAPAYYRNRLQPTEEDLRTWIGEHEEEVDREYQANRHEYTGLDPQVRASHILIKAGAEASEEVRAAARQRAQGLLERTRAGEDFSELAREHSEHEGSARRGGDLGYNPRGRMVGPFDEAQFELEIDEISDLVETRYGFHIIKVTGKREGDVPEEEAKLELAERLYRESEAEAMARREAEEALAALRSGTSMDELAAQLRGEPTDGEGEGEGTTGGEDGGTAEGEGTTEGEGDEGDPGDGDADEPEEPDDPLAPRVRETRSFGRSGQPISGLQSTPLAQAAFELTLEEPLPEEPIQLGDEWVVYQLTELELATEEDFTDDVRRRISEGLRQAKEREALRLYVHRLRRDAEEEGALRINESVLRYEDESGEGEGGEGEEGEEGEAG